MASPDTDVQPAARARQDAHVVSHDTAPEDAVTRKRRLSKQPIRDSANALGEPDSAVAVKLNQQLFPTQ